MNLRRSLAAFALTAAWPAVAAADEEPPPSLAPDAPQVDAHGEPDPSRAPEPTTETDAVVGSPYRPRSVRWRGLLLEAPALLSERLDHVGSFQTDADGGEFGADPAFDATARAGARLSTEMLLRSVRLVAELEADIVTGIHRGGVEPRFASDSLDAPLAPGTDFDLRKAWGQLDITQYAHLFGGRTTSHWGMGLMANDGAHRWEPGSARFVMPSGGDRLVRVMAAFGPFTDEAVAIAFGLDEVVKDDSFHAGDTTYQLFAALTWRQGRPTSAGVLVLGRRTEAESDGDLVDVGVLDLTATHSTELGDSLALGFEAEGAWIVGTNTFGTSPDQLERDVRQFGAMGRVSLSGSSFGLHLDGLFASGDETPDDGASSAFRADPNSDPGLVLFRYLQAAWTARQAVTAFDPELSGVPTEDLDRIPSRGAPGNVLAIAPRVWWRPILGVEIYGGPLFAFTARRPVDPLNTRLAGGAPRNALNGEPGGYWGTELDLGLRWRLNWDGSQLDLGAEAGLLLPGSATYDASGDAMDPVSSGRLLVEYAL